MTNDYKDTLNLPKTKFSMRANLPKREPDFLDYWESISLYKKLLEKKSRAEENYILHDGPPYANGDIHVGHALNKVLKDIVCRFHWLSGRYAPYVPGWDCHGQPIEQQVEKQLGEKKKQLSQIQFRKLCREYAEKYIDRQREQFKRLGVIGTWQKPYLTLDHSYEATNIRTFHKLYNKGLVVKGKKPIYWCYNDTTALAEAEIEYREKESPSIKVKFELLEKLEGVKPPVYALIWTTTPWTLPANVAIAFHPDVDYGVYDNGSERLIIATSLTGENIDESWKQVAIYPGKVFEGKKFRHAIFPEKESVGILGDFVDLSTGTGIVHIAPGHGQVDYLAGEEYGLPVVMPVDDRGKFTEDAGIFAGSQVYEANDEIVSYLKEKNLLFDVSKVLHSYPHCWRCKKPVIFRATEQWFIAVRTKGLKRDSVKAIEDVKWIPGWNKNRIQKMIEQRPDWCISRQRSWGVPIPIIYCVNCNKIQDNDEVFNHIARIFEEEGADSWFEKQASYFVPEEHRCSSCGSQDFKKEKDIFDVWFESGVSHFAVLKNRKELHWPSDMYLEGSDQHRGWFQSSLLTSVGSTGKPPYREVLTHGFIVDEEGRKMSKSLGNVVDPMEVIDEMGADVLRLWVAASDYTSDVAISSQILQRITDTYRRIRNTFRFLLGNLYDFNPSENSIEPDNLDAIDKYILSKLYDVNKKVLNSYENYRYHSVVHSIHSFCAVDLSAFYLDVLKDRLYTELPNSKLRRSSQTAIYIIARTLAKLLAPVLPFTSEDVWKEMPLPNKNTSIHLENFEKLEKLKPLQVIGDDWDKLLEVRKDFLKAYEKAKTKEVVNTIMEVHLLIVPDKSYSAVLNKWIEYLPLVFGTKNVEIVEDIGDDIPVKENLDSGTIGIKHFQGKKCERCWNWLDDIENGVCKRCRKVIEKLEQPGGSGETP